MGFKKSASFKVMPGVRVRVSTKGVSAYAGRTKIIGTSTPSSTRKSPARRAPARNTAPAPAPRPAPAVKPGLLAAKEEKALYAYAVTRQAPVLDPIVRQHPVFERAAAAIMGLQDLEAGHLESSVQALQSVIHGLSPIESNPFLLKYLPNFSFELEIAGGVTAQLPLTMAALTLALAEALQTLGRIPEAIQYVEQLDPTYPALLSLTELYSGLGDWEEVLRLTDQLPVNSELTAALAILRAQAHFGLDQLVAAKECLKSLVSGKKFPENLRFQALALRSNISLADGAYSQAASDLEKILAENSSISGIREALAEVQEAQRVAVQRKVDMAARKAAETVRIREEKAAEAVRVREEKIAAQLALKNVPVMQTGVINLSDDAGVPEAAPAEEPRLGTASNIAAVPSPSTARAPGFYPDPEELAPYRFWDGSSWTSRVRMTP